MLTLPLPFIIPILLLILCVRLAFLRSYAAAIFLAICALDSVVVALRWSFHIESARMLQPLSAFAIPLVAWWCFAPLQGRRVRLWPWVASAVTPYLLTIAWIPWNPVDLVLGSLYLGTGLALMSFNWSGADSLGAARLSDMPQARRTLYLAGGALLASCLFNSVIAADFDLNDGIHVINLVAGFNVVAVPLLAYAAAVANPILVREMADSPKSDTPAVAASVQAAPDDDDLRVFEVFNGLMREKTLFKDPDLTLNRLGRRAGLPARRLSVAVNRATGRNISQVVNEFGLFSARR